MNKDFQSIIALVIGVAGIATAASSFSAQLNTVEKKGLTFGGGLALLGLGIVLYNRIEDTAGQARRLL